MKMGTQDRNEKHRKWCIHMPLTERRRAAKKARRNNHHEEG